MYPLQHGIQIVQIVNYVERNLRFLIDVTIAVSADLLLVMHVHKIVYLYQVIVVLHVYVCHALKLKWVKQHVLV